MRVFVAMSDTAEQSGKIATDAAYALAVAGRDEAERRLARRAAEIGEPAAARHVPGRRRACRVPRRASTPSTRASSRSSPGPTA